MITANLYYNTSFEEWRLKVIIPIMARMLLPIGRTIEFEESAPMTAYVNHGRWIIKCECGGAELAWEECVFMCRSCYNSTSKHHFRRSVFPKQRSKIESLLMVRPLLNRNWNPGETIKDLEIENACHEEELL